MATVIVLFRLKAGVEVGRYERWARETDLPVVRALASVREFTIHRSLGLLGGGRAPYDYVEVLQIEGLREFQRDLAAAAIERLAAEFAAFAEAPAFIHCEAL